MSVYLLTSVHIYIYNRTASMMTIEAEMGIFLGRKKQKCFDC